MRLERLSDVVFNTGAAGILRVMVAMVNILTDILEAVAGERALIVAWPSSPS